VLRLSVATPLHNESYWHVESYWHLADNPNAPAFVAYWNNNGQLFGEWLNMSAANDPTRKWSVTQSGRGAFTKCSAWPSPVVGAGIEDDDEGALMGFAGSMRANCCPSQLGFAGAWVTPSGISTQGSFSAHQICRLGATQLGSSSVPALMNAIAPYAGPWL
jgi:hypothetical protein